MNKATKIWSKSMDAIMLNCDKATLLITKSEYVSLSCIERVQLTMHLAGCKFCRRFKKQNKIISLALKQEDKVLVNEKISLSPEQKQRMKIRLNNSTKGN